MYQLKQKFLKSTNLIKNASSKIVYYVTKNYTERSRQQNRKQNILEQDGVHFR